MNFEPTLNYFYTFPSKIFIDLFLITVWCFKQKLRVVSDSHPLSWLSGWNLSWVELHMGLKMSNVNIFLLWFSGWRIQYAAWWFHHGLPYRTSTEGKNGVEILFGCSADLFLLQRFSSDSNHQNFLKLDWTFYMTMEVTLIGGETFHEKQCNSICQSRAK